MANPRTPKPPSSPLLHPSPTWSLTLHNVGLVFSYRWSCACIRTALCMCTQFPDIRATSVFLYCISPFAAFIHATTGAEDAFCLCTQLFILSWTEDTLWLALRVLARPHFWVKGCLAALCDAMVSVWLPFTYYTLRRGEIIPVMALSWAWIWNTEEPSSLLKHETVLWSEHAYKKTYIHMHK